MAWIQTRMHNVAHGWKLLKRTKMKHPVDSGYSVLIEMNPQSTNKRATHLCTGQLALVAKEDGGKNTFLNCVESTRLNSTSNNTCMNLFPTRNEQEIQLEINS